MPVAKSKLFAGSPMTLRLTQVPIRWHNGEDVQRPYWKKGCTIKEDVSGKDKVTDAVITRVYPAGVSWSLRNKPPGLNPEISTKRDEQTAKRQICL